MIIARQSNTHWVAGDVILPLGFAGKKMLQLGRKDENFAEVPLTFYGVQHTTGDESRASFASMFCYYYFDYLQDQYPEDNIQLLLIPAGAIGSGWNQTQYPGNSWRTDDVLYKDLVKRIKWANGNGYQIDAFLWHQGETEASGLTVNYTDLLINFIQSVREHAGNAELPFVLGQMSPSWVAQSASRAPYQTILNSIPTLVPYTYTVATDNIPVPDILHFSAAGHYELGMRYYNGFLLAKDNAAPSGYTLPEAGEYLLLNHNSATGQYFANAFDAIRKNEANPSHIVHSKLGDIWKYKNADCYYHFKLLVVSGGSLANTYFEWKQKYSPFGISETFF